MPDNKKKVIPIDSSKISPLSDAEVHPLLKDSALPISGDTPYVAAIGNTDYGNSKYDYLNNDKGGTLESTPLEDIYNGNYQFNRGEKQSGLTQVGLGVLRAAGKAAIEIAKTPAYLYSLGEYTLQNGATAINNHFLGTEDKGLSLDKALDNSMLNYLEGLDNDMKENLPVYKSYKSGKGGLMDNIASTSFWASEGAEGVGYMLGMLAPGAGLKAINMAGKLSKLGIGVSAANNLELGTMTMVNTAVESLAEAKGVGDRIRKELNENPIDPNTGQEYTQEEKDKKIADASRDTFNANLGILLIPNLIMNKALLGRFGKDKSILDRFRDPLTGKLMSSPAAKKMLKEYGKTALKMTASEGFLEEGGQTTVENYEVNHALGKDNRNFFEGVAHEYINTLDTTEGQKAILLGAVLGTIAGGAGAYKQNKAEEKRLPVLSELISKNFEGFSVENDIYERNEDGSQVIDPTTNKPKINPEKVSEALRNFVAESKDSQAQDLASFNDDKTLHDFITHKQFTRYALPFLQQGEVGLEILNEHLDNVSKTRHLIDEQELAENRGIDFDEKQYIAKLKQKAKDLQDIYTNTRKVIDDLPAFDQLDKTVEDKELLDQYKAHVFNAIFQENSKMLFYAEKMRDLNREILEMQSAVSYELPQNKLIVEELIKDVKGLNNLLQDSKAKYNSLFDNKQHEIAFENIQKAKKEFQEAIQEVTQEQEKANTVTDTQNEIAGHKEEIAKSLIAAYDATDIESFDAIYDTIKSNPFLDKKQKDGLIEKRKELIGATFDVTNVDETNEENQNSAGYGTIAADYLLTGGTGTMLSTDYLLQALSGTFTKAGSLINQIRNKYAKEIADNNLSDIKDFANTDLYNKIISEIREAINNSYSNKEEAQKILDQILKHPTGLPNKLGNQVSIELDNLHESEPKDIITTVDDQEAVSTALQTYTTANETEENQDTLNTDLTSLEQEARSEKHINLRNNVVMMHLFNHYFDKAGNFRFSRNEQGLPSLDNNSDISINELNKIQKGDIVQMRLVTLNKEQLSNFTAPKDFDGEHIGIYSNDKLIGFVQQPHSVDPDSKNKDVSEDLRDILITYRKDVIKKLKANEVVEETITQKGSGNLYTKLNDKGKIDPINNIVLDARDRDKTNGALTFVHSDGEKLVLPQTNMSEKEVAKLQEVLSNIGNLGRKGQVFQLVKNLKDSWSVIPVYATVIDDFTAKKIIDTIGKFDNNAIIEDIISALNEFVFASSHNEKANILINKKSGPITFFINEENYTLDDLLNNESRKKSFIQALKTKRQNISTRRINNAVYQKTLKDRNTLVSNITTFNGEYFVQPYLEFSYNNLLDTEEPITESEVLNITTSNTRTDAAIDKNQIDELKDKFGISEDDMQISEDDALSRTQVNPDLNRTKFTKWLKTNLPQLTLSEVSNIADLKVNITDAYGLFKDLTIHLFEGAGNKTAYHEAFHGVFRNILSTNERHGLIQEAIQKYETPSTEQLIALNEGLSKQYTLDQLRYLYYEEKLADDFAEFTDNLNNRTFLQKIKGKIRDLFNKILSYFNIFTLNNQFKINDLFNKVNTKQYASKEVVTNKVNGVQVFNRPFSTFDDEYAYSKALSKVFGPSTEQKIVTTIGNRYIAVYQANLAEGKDVRGLLIYKDILDIYQDFLKRANIDPSKFKKEDVVLALKIRDKFPTIIKEVDKFLAYRNIISKDNDIQFVEELTEDKLDDEEITSLQSQTTKGYGDWTSVSGLSSASTRLKLFLSSIPVMDEDNHIKKDIFGIEQYHDFTKLYYFIERELTGIYTLDEQIDYLKDLSVNRPELKPVIDTLTNKPSNKTQEEFELLRNDFKTNFSKQQLAYTLIKFDTDSTTGKVTYRIIESNRKSINREVQNSWEDNLTDPNRKTIAIHNNDGTITKYGTPASKELLEEWNNIVKNNKLTFNTVNSLLLKAGIEYSENTLKKLIEDNSAYFKSNVTTLLEWYSSEKPVDKEQTGRKALKELVNFETTTVLTNYTSSFNDVENKNIYSIQLPAFVSKLLARLKSDNFATFENTLNTFRNDPFYKHSNLLQEFESDTPFRKNEFFLSYLDGLKDEKGESKGSKFTSMSSKDFMSMQIALFQNKASNEQKITSNKLSKYIYITPSDKSMSMIFDSKQYGVNLSEDFKSIKLNSDIVNKFYNLFLSEASRIKHNLDIKNDILSKRENSNYSLSQLLEHYHISKASFKTLQPYIKAQIEGKTIKDEDWKIIATLFDGQAYKTNYFSQKFNNNLIGKITEIAENSTENNLEENLEAIKDNILEALERELYQEFRLTLTEMKNKGLITGEFSSTYQNKTLDLKEDLSSQETSDEIKRLIANFSLNTMLANIEISNLLNGDMALYKPNDLQKRTYQSQSMITNNNFIDKTIRTIVVKDVEVRSEQADAIKDTLKQLGFSEEEISKIVAYDNVNVTDAQVYILPSLYKKIHLSRGTWTKEMQEAYNIIEGIKPSTKIKESLHVLLGGIKPFYYGNRFDKDLGMMKYEQVKCAMIPLFKGYTDINPLLAKNRKQMEDAGVEMLAHESAFKATIGFRDDITSDNHIILDLDTDNFGIQVDNPEHTLEATNDSMRQLKMLLIGSIDNNKTYKGTSGQTIIDSILEMEGANIAESLRELNKKIDIKSNLNFTQFIKDMVTKRGATSNVEELLNIQDGDFEYPLDNGTLSTQIENMISSIFTNNVIKQDFKGGSAVQATSLGLRFKNLLDQQEGLTPEALLLQQELQWIKPTADGIEYAECAMPAWSKDFFNEKGLLKDINTIPEELRSLITYRIPTEGLHSMLPIKVVKFLPETMGNFILLPYEVTTQMGADFDFDKLYFITKEFYKGDDNTFVPYNYINGDIKEEIEKRWEQYLEYTPLADIKANTREEWNKLSIAEQNNKGARNNRIIDNYFTLLSAKENLHLLVKPSGFEKLKDIKLQYFKSFQKDNFFSSRVQRDYKDRNHIGIALKGQSALHVSGHSYSTLLPLTSESYTKEGHLDRTKSINFNGSNKFNFNNLYTENGDLIADELSSIMAAILDDIKDPILEPLGINKNTIDVLATIIRSGYNMETAIKFIAQPGIKELSALLDLNQAKIKELNQGWNNISNVIQQYDDLLKDALSKLDSNIKDNPSFINLIDLANKQTTDIRDEELSYYLENYRDAKLVKEANNEEKAEYYAFQIRVLKNFEHISKIAKELTEINKFFSVNKQVGPNIEDIISKQQLLENIENSEVIKGFDINLIPSLKKTWEVHERAVEFFSDYFPYSTDYYMSIKNKVYDMQSKKTLDQVPVADRQFINNFIRYYMDNNFGRFEDISENYEKLFVSLPKLIGDIKNPLLSNNVMGKVSYEQIKNNLFINELKYEYDSKNGIYFLTLKGNRLDLQVKNNMIEAFKALYNNSSTKELAIDLIDHSFANSGFFSGKSSYASIISPEILKELGYMDHRKNLIKALNNDQVAIDDKEESRIIDQMIRNNPKPFTKVFDSDMFLEDMIKGAPNTITTTEEMIIEANRKDDMILDEDTYPQYIRVYDKVNKKALIYKSRNGRLVYDYIPNLGKKGFMIEVNPSEDIRESFLSENNTIKDGNFETIVDQESKDFQDDINKPILEDGYLEDLYNGEKENTESSDDETLNNENSKDDLPNDIKPC